MSTSWEKVDLKARCEGAAWARTLKITGDSRGYSTKIWEKHGRLRVYVEGVGHVRLHPSAVELHGDGRTLKGIFGDALYGWPCLG